MEKVKRLGNQQLEPDQQMHLLNEIDQVQYASSFIHRPNAGGLGPLGQGAQGAQGTDSHFFESNDQIHSSS